MGRALLGLHPFAEKIQHPFDVFYRYFREQGQVFHQALQVLHLLVEARMVALGVPFPRDPDDVGNGKFQTIGLESEPDVVAAG